MKLGLLKEKENILLDKRQLEKIENELFGLYTSNTNPKISFIIFVPHLL